MAKLELSNYKLARVTAGIFLTLLLGFFISSPLNAQPVLGGQNTALGGGGTAYLTGYEATLGNPANLAINDRLGTLHFGVGHLGILYEPVLSSGVADEQFLNFTDSFYPYKPSAVAINSGERVTILDKNYPRNSLRSQHQTRADIILGGISWQRNDAAFSLVARARFASRIDVGRGWYSDEFIPSGGREVRDFTLEQQTNEFLEFSLGYGREFTFIEGLLPRLSKLYVGIAPKLVLSGPSFNARYDARYIRSDEGSPTVYTTDFFYRTTGNYSRMTFDYLNTPSNPQAAINQNLDRSVNFETTGYGVGFDFGLTYLVPLGDELNIIEESAENSVVAKSLRFAISVNDLGMIRYHESPLELSSQKDTVSIGQEPTKKSMFIGSGGQYLNYFDEADTLSNPLQSAMTKSEGSFSVLMPTSLNAGVLIDLSRIKVMGDLTLGLNNTALTSTKLAIHLGLEGRPIQKIPVRLGARLASGLPTHISFGTGFETRYWDLSLGTQVIFRSQTFTSEFVGGAFAGIQFHL